MNDSKVFVQSGDTLSVPVSGGSSNDEPLTGSGSVLRIVNRTGQLIYVKCGVGAQTADDGDFFVPPDTISYLGISFEADTVAIYMAAGGNTTVSVARGAAA